MVWESLEDRLNDLPYVLAGPILRKVTPKSVTVWLVTRIGASVKLKVMNAQDETQNLMEGERKTVAIGKNLHIVAVTAKLLSGKADLTEGNIYLYDIDFSFDTNESLNLNLATNGIILSYDELKKPSFALPPRDINHLRILQGSCRMPHAEGNDMFPYIDNLIAENSTNAYARLHQLFLTGDQIYADDVADLLLPLLSDAGEALLGWKETFAIKDDPNFSLSRFPYQRTLRLLNAGFTSDSMQNHLTFLGEYLAMYLFVWSDVLWPAQLPTYEDIEYTFKPTIPIPIPIPIPDGMMEDLRYATKMEIDEQRVRLQQFRQHLRKVRRALANIPTYMIFDDHEVTDDWNETRKWCSKIYADDNALGSRIIQNGLVAYSLCQHWGNAPEQFESLSTPGGDLLKRLSPGAPNNFSLKSSEYNQNSDAIRRILGIQTETALKAEPKNALFHDPFSLEYNYYLECPGHVVIVTDTRTWRAFPLGGINAPDLLRDSIDLRKNQYTSQFSSLIDLKDRALFIVLTTNAPSIQPIRATERFPRTTRAVRFHPDIYESWRISSVAFERLIKAITDLLPKNTSGERYGSAILLSGDVHHSFASRLSYSATNRYEDSTAQPTAAIIAQLTTSSFKKEDADTRSLQKGGYTYSPWIGKVLGAVPPHLPEPYVGWNHTQSTRRKVGLFFDPTSEMTVPPVPVGLFISSQSPTVALWGDKPATRDMIFFDSTPHYRYRLDYLLPISYNDPLSIPPPVTGSSSGTTPEERKKAGQKYKTALNYYLKECGDPKKIQIIGVNNFSEITLQWGAANDRAVFHKIHWRIPPGDTLNVSTIYKVNLTPDEPFANLLNINIKQP